MNLYNAERATVLVEALPYIKKYNGKVVVIKYGGNAMINDDLKQRVMEDIVLLTLIGVKVVLVHGGGPEITDMLERVGKESKFVDGLRVTDKESTEIVQMVLAGKINKSLVNLLETKGGKAMGICGIDGQMIKAEVKDERLGFVGKITDVNVEPVTDLLDRGYIPVVSTIGCDKQGNVYNINADTAAAYIAGAMKADRFILMTDIAGILHDKDNPDSLVPLVDIKEAAELFNNEFRLLKNL
ncbi:Acetylglutamate kinase [Chlamydia trachomatis]|nr:Acetylglutamate kinase [Chlamydia trachomatis]